MPHRTFSLNEAAEYLHLPQADIEKLVRQGEIPFEHKGPRLVFRKIDLDAWGSRRILGLNEKKLSDYHKTTSVKTDALLQSHAIISELARKTVIRLDLASKTKPSLLRDMTILAEKSLLVFDARDLLQSLEEREKLCSTALADGFALLHPRHHAPYMFEDSFIAFGKTLNPIPFGAPDGSETDLFFLICCQNDRLHLHVLARLCLMCRQKTFLLQLREAGTPAEIRLCLRARELEAIKQTGAPAGLTTRDTGISKH
ncbi:MAG: PTS sugar transporter subunit IIA [Kiritimatiellae bacterium]|nr:PTS sugar transporter subunit IIA [Kiritimatiellia bacterium]